MADVVVEKVSAAANFLMHEIWGLIYIQDPGDRMYWLYLLSFFVIAGILCLVRKPQDSSLIGFFLPKDVYTSVSFRTDLKIYFLNGLLSSLVNLSAVLISTVVVAGFITNWLPAIVGGSSRGLPPDTWSTLFFSAAFVLLTDFGLFAAHYVGHKVPFFWAFHKVHHSAEVLTPVTAYRFHPVDLVLNGIAVALAVGPLVGVYQFVYSGELFTGSPVLYAYVMFLYLLTANFRHSHFSLHFPAFVCPWLVSPAMHNLHHSTAQIHRDKNLGFVFSIWDRMAGTYFLPEKNLKLNFGIGQDEEKEYRTLSACYILPIVRAGKMALNAAKRILPADS